MEAVDEERGLDVKSTWWRVGRMISSFAFSLFFTPKQPVDLLDDNHRCEFSKM
jgi:hypothetical protein